MRIDAVRPRPAEEREIRQSLALQVSLRRQFIRLAARQLKGGIVTGDEGCIENVASGSEAIRISRTVRKQIEELVEEGSAIGGLVPEILLRLGKPLQRSPRANHRAVAA